MQSARARRWGSKLLIVIIGFVGGLLIALPVRAEVAIRAEKIPEQYDAGVAANAKREVIRAFMQTNPDVRVDPFVMPVVGGSGVQDTGPLMAIAAGVSPDVMFVNFRKSSTYISQNFLEPLEVLLARVLSRNERERQTDSRGKWLQDPTPTEITEALEQIRERVKPPIWPVVYRADESKGAGAEKHVWAIPNSHMIIVLLYRKDLFYEAGLDPEKPPRDWDELLEYARKLTVPQRRQYGFGTFQANISWALMWALTSNGARIVEQDPRSGEWRAVYDTPQCAQAIVFLWRLIREAFEKDGQIIHGAAYQAPVNYNIEWTQGKLAMIASYMSEELLASINPQLMGIAPVPVSPRGTRSSEVNAELFGVFTQSPPEKQLAAMRYIWFTTSEEAHRIRTRVYVDSGYGQFVNPDLLEQFGYERLLKTSPRGWKAVFDTAMKTGVPEPYGKNSNSIYRYLSQPINTALEHLDEVPPPRREQYVLGLLHESAGEVNRKLLGVMPPAELRMRRGVAGAVMVIVALAFAIGLAHVWRYFGRMARASGERGTRRTLVVGYLLLGPALLLVLTWHYFPLAGGAAVSVVDYQLTQPSRFVGLDNFAAALFDEKFWLAFARTFYFVLLVIGLGFWPPILLAILLQEIPTTTAKYFFRVVYFLPAVVSGVIVMFLWRQLYDPSERGLLNQIVMSVNGLGPMSATLAKWVLVGLWVMLIVGLARMAARLTELTRAMRSVLWAGAIAFTGVLLWTIADVGFANLVGRFHVPPLRWISSPGLAMVCIVIPMVWATAGHASILYLAALKNVPEEMYEAADLDGASHWHKVFYLALPRLKYLITIQFIAAVVAAFKGGTDYILALTGGGPNEATTVLALEIFFRTFLDLSFGVGAAMAWILGALLIGFTAYQLKMLSRAEFRTAT